VEEGTVNVRRFGQQAQETLTADRAVALLQAEAVPPDLARR
jgi:hypothetical protein